MIIKEIIELLDEMRDAYNSGFFDFSSWHETPLFFVEDSCSEIITDPVIVSRLLETISNCSKYLALPKIDFCVQYLLMISEKIAITSVVWEFSNANQKIELVLEVGHIMQKKDDVWKIVALLQPTWRDPKEIQSNIKKTPLGGGLRG